ncbi:MAG: hypothetical protein KBT15_10340 [Bacteroidales bacterium]|nr:hypothetical protein [Candidatus Minthousia equi]
MKKIFYLVICIFIIVACKEKKSSESAIDRYHIELEKEVTRVQMPAGALFFQLSKLVGKDQLNDNEYQLYRSLIGKINDEYSQYLGYQLDASTIISKEKFDIIQDRINIGLRLDITKKMQGRLFEFVK